MREQRHPFVTFSSDRKQATNFSNYEDAKIHVIEYKTKFSGNEKLKSVAFESKYGRIIELDSGDHEERMNMNEIIPKHHLHQFTHNCSASEINDGTCSISIKTNFYHNLLIFFPTVTFLQTHMILFKEMTEKYFKWTLDERTDDISDSILATLEGDSESGFCIDQTTL